MTIKKQISQNNPGKCVIRSVLEVRKQANRGQITCPRLDIYEVIAPVCKFGPTLKSSLSF